MAAGDGADSERQLWLTEEIKKVQLRTKDLEKEQRHRRKDHAKKIKELKKRIDAAEAAPGHDEEQKKSSCCPDVAPLEKAPLQQASPELLNRLRELQEQLGLAPGAEPTELGASEEEKQPISASKIAEDANAFFGATAPHREEEAVKRKQKLQDLERKNRALADKLGELEDAAERAAEQRALEAAAPIADVAAVSTEDFPLKHHSRESFCTAEATTPRPGGLETPRAGGLETPRSVAGSAVGSTSGGAGSPSACHNLGALMTPTQGDIDASLFPSAPSSEAEVSAPSSSAGEAAPGKGAGKGSKGGGKGKGKGSGLKGPPGPPPSSRASLPGQAPKAKAGGHGNAPAKRSSLISLHWKVLQSPVADIAEAPSAEAFMRESEDEGRLPGEEESAADERFAELHKQACLEVPPRLSFGAIRSSSCGKENAGGSQGNRRLTVFNSPLEGDPQVKELPQELLELYFKKGESQLKMPGPEATSDSNKMALNTNALLDDKALKMVGIFLQKHLMAHKVGSVGKAILNIKRSVLRCDYKVVGQEGLSVIRTVLRHHEREGDKITLYVRQHGVTALDRLEHPEYHRLLHELMKVPQIDERLECMLFHTAFMHHDLNNCRRELKTMRQALSMLKRKREKISSFFKLVQKFGQMLNRDSQVSLAERGFQLSTLEKLSQTKSTKLPKKTIMHFLLALMNREEARALFNDEDLTMLLNAKMVSTFKCYSDCLELLQGFHAVNEICHTGSYREVKIERRRKSGMMHCKPDSEALDGDDRFHATMKGFVDEYFTESQSIALEVHDVMMLYKELAVFFDDIGSVYPPPACEGQPETQNAKQDLVAVFHKFALDFKTHREDVEREGLREDLALSARFSLTGGAGAAAAAAQGDAQPALAAAAPTAVTSSAEIPASAAA